VADLAEPAWVSFFNREETPPPAALFPVIGSTDPALQMPTSQKKTHPRKRHKADVIMLCLQIISSLPLPDFRIA
jgi:hypothetical protein